MGLGAFMYVQRSISLNESERGGTVWQLEIRLWWLSVLYTTAREHADWFLLLGQIAWMHVWYWYQSYKCSCKLKLRVYCSGNKCSCNRCNRGNGKSVTIPRCATKQTFFKKKMYSAVYNVKNFVRSYLGYLQHLVM
jgi:hypothetical protein